MVETRVDKFKTYRDEIQASFSDCDITTKKKTSDRVEKLLEEQEGISDKNESLSIDEMIDAYEIYDKGVNNEKSPLLSKGKKRRIYIIFAASVCLILVGITIALAIMTFGGK